MATFDRCAAVDVHVQFQLLFEQFNVLQSVHITCQNT